MANQNDSFIDEVTDELRRDRLYAGFRRYGWIGILAILLIVGAAAWREYSAAQDRQRAEAFGDALIAAEGAGKPAEALAVVEPGGSPARAGLVGLLAAGAMADAGDAAGAAARLDGVAAGLETQGDDAVLRDLARLKQVIAAGETMDPAARDAALAELAKPGAPFELLALEQQAAALVGAGRRDDAVTLIRQVQERDGMTEGLRRRLSEMMIALGVEPDPADAKAPPPAAPAMN